jgi:hypothetical protein
VATPPANDSTDAIKANFAALKGSLDAYRPELSRVDLKVADHRVKSVRERVES